MLRRSVFEEEEEEAGALKAAERPPGLQGLPRRPWDVDSRARCARLEEARWLEGSAPRPQGVRAVARGNAFPRTPHTVWGWARCRRSWHLVSPQHTASAHAWVLLARASTRHQTPAHA